MENFKGTKTKWLKSKTSIGFVYALDKKNERNVFSLCINNDGKVSDEEIEYNALLISKSPEMLEMLKKAERTLREVYDCDTNEIQQLIKQATEI